MISSFHGMIPSFHGMISSFHAVFVLRHRDKSTKVIDYNDQVIRVRGYLLFRGISSLMFLLLSHFLLYLCGASSQGYGHKKKLQDKCPRAKPFLCLSDVVPPGIEPGTQGFSVLCSTNWAMAPLFFAGTKVEQRFRSCKYFSIIFCIPHSGESWNGITRYIRGLPWLFTVRPILLHCLCVFLQGISARMMTF